MYEQWTRAFPNSFSESPNFRSSLQSNIISSVFFLLYILLYCLFYGQTSAVLLTIHHTGPRISRQTLSLLSFLFMIVEYPSQCVRAAVCSLCTCMIQSYWIKCYYFHGANFLLTFETPLAVIGTRFFGEVQRVSVSSVAYISRGNMDKFLSKLDENWN